MSFDPLSPGRLARTAACGPYRSPSTSIDPCGVGVPGHDTNASRASFPSAFLPCRQQNVLTTLTSCVAGIKSVPKSEK